jgi:predicted metal-dependent hydrolase
MPILKYLTGYPEDVKAQVRQLIAQDQLGEMLRKKYPESHDVRTDKALYDYTFALKNRFLRKAEPLSKVLFDNNLQVIRNALGTHSTVPRVQGGRVSGHRQASHIQGFCSAVGGGDTALDAA